MSEAEEAMLLADWIDALSDLPHDAVDRAIRQWIREEPRRPTPAHIRAAAKALIAPPKAKPEPERPFGPVVTDPAELERRREMAAKIVREVGMVGKAMKRATHREAGLFPRREPE